MRKLIAVLGLCLMAFPVFCQSTPKYEVATILDIKPHNQSGTPESEGGASYDVTVKIGDTIYVALYTPHFGELAAKYAAGRELLVQVSKTTITYHDLIGRSYEVPITSQKAASTAKERSQ